MNPYITWNLEFVYVTPATAARLMEEGKVYQPEPESDPLMFYPEDSDHGPERSEEVMAEVRKLSAPFPGQGRPVPTWLMHHLGDSDP